MHEFHPVIRIVSFVVLTAFLALGAAVNILIGAAVMALLYVRIKGQAWKNARRMLRRMRWLFLSIAVIYLWLTPGEPVVSGAKAFAPWLPTVDGLWQGGLRISSLALMVVAASLLLHVTARNQMLAALRWLLTPLGVLGMPHERFAVRAALTLEAVTQVQGQVRGALATGPATATPVSRIGALAAVMFSIVMQEAELAPCSAIEMPALRSPPLWQWGIPLLLFAVMAATRHWTL
jgi:energy-coupling factor transporter transmembrane protein EcfT